MQAQTVKQGSTGAPVRAVQILVNGYDGAGLAVDGVFGPNTDRAVRAFQTRHGLPADGIVGAHTWGALVGVPQ